MDTYFKTPILWDILISIAGISTFYLFPIISDFSLHSARIIGLCSDIFNIGFTSTGFVITLLTILITFKANSKITKENYTEHNTLFEIFFTSELYHKTVNILKYCIGQLLLTSFLGVMLKLLIEGDQIRILFYYNIGSILLIVLAMARCLWILTKIMKFQKSSN